MKIRILFWLIFGILFFFGCSSGECTTSENIKVSFDYLSLARMFFDSAVVLFQTENKQQGLSRLYYMFFSLQTINIYKKTGNLKVKGQKKHENAWKGSNAKKEVKKAFGKNGFLSIRIKCDYSYLEDHEILNSLDFWKHSTDHGYKKLISETENSLSAFAKCNIPNCDCQIKHRSDIEKCKNLLQNLDLDYSKFFKENAL